MHILVDTSVWSMALRKTKLSTYEEKVINYFSEIIRNLNLVIIGPIRQEILSGISNKGRFEELKDKLSVFVDHPIETNDYELAAELFNDCRSKGIQGSHIDFIICAISINKNIDILTLDKDFDNYKMIVPIRLIKIA